LLALWFRLVFIHTSRMSSAVSDYRSIWNRHGDFRVIFIPSGFDQLYQFVSFSI
jgi:hypothetical protein